MKYEVGSVFEFYDGIHELVVFITDDTIGSIGCEKHSYKGVCLTRLSDFEEWLRDNRLRIIL